MASHPAVLMRGYGAKRKGEPNDEARELLWALPRTPVICNPNRHAGAVLAARKGCDLAILDDGFQHWQLARLLDIVLLDATDPFGGGHLLPWGRLRESPRALARADVVILTRCDLAAPDTVGEPFIARIKRLAPYAALCRARHAPVEVNTLWTEEEPRPPSSVEGKRVVAACGLGNPGAFQATLEGLGAEVAARRNFPDHHQYTRKDLAALLELAKANEAEAVVVTEKDAVKIEALHSLPPDVEFPVWALGIGVEVVEGEEELWKRIEAVLRAATPRIQLK
jgi:tetraacyldisaccharide 4'-kinase